MNKRSLSLVADEIFSAHRRTASGTSLEAENMPPAKDGGANPFADTVQERVEDHKLARLQHRRRFISQCSWWGVKIALAAVSIPLLYLYTHDYFASCVEEMRSTTGCHVQAGSYFLPSLILSGLLIGNFIYHGRSLHDWEVAMGKAQQFTDRENVATGYTDLFSIYVRTKRRSYHVIAWGLLAFLYALCGGLIPIYTLGANTDMPIILWAPILNAVLGTALLILGYQLGSVYLPGDVIVRHTLALIIYAVTNVTDPNMARRQAAQEADHFVRKNPWWFYSH